MVRFFRRYSLGGIFHQGGRNHMLDRLCAMWAMNFAHGDSGSSGGSSGSGGNTYDKYSWEGVFASIDAGTYATDYAIGDMIPLDLGSEGLINMQIAAFDTDDLADGSGKAPITWISKELLATKHQLHDTTDAAVKWHETSMYEYLNDTIKPMIPNNVRIRISAVTKSTWEWIGVLSHTSTCELWIPSCIEVEIPANAPSGATIKYNGIYSTNNDTRIKTHLGVDSAWWLRDHYTKNGSMYIAYHGGRNTCSATLAQGVCLCFCT